MRTANKLIKLKKLILRQKRYASCEMPLILLNVQKSSVNLSDCKYIQLDHIHENKTFLILFN